MVVESIDAVWKHEVVQHLAKKCSLQSLFIVLDVFVIQVCSNVFLFEVSQVSLGIRVRCAHHHLHIFWLHIGAWFIGFFVCGC